MSDDSGRPSKRALLAQATTGLRITVVILFFILLLVQVLLAFRVL